MLQKLYHTLFSERQITSHHLSLLDATLKIGAFGFFTYSLFVYFVFSQELLALLNASAFVLFLLSYIDFRINKNYIRTSTLSSITFTLFFILLIQLTSNQNTTLFGSILLPIFVFSVNGRFLGALYSTLFFAAVYTLAYQGVSVWNEGTFTYLAYTHYIAATLLLTLFIYFLERAFESYIDDNQEQNKQLKEAQQLASIGSWEWDIKENRSKWSDETFRIFGLDPQKDKASITMSREITHPDDLQLLDESVKLAIKMRQDYDIVRRIILKDGQEKIVQSRAKIDYDEQGNPVHMIGTVQDITKQRRIKNSLREQKEAFETIFTKSHDGILIIKEGRFIDCNDAALRMLGASSKEQLLKALPGEISPPIQPDGRDSTKKAQEMMQKALEESIASFECYHKRFDGSIFIVDVVLTRLEINNESVIHASWRDISERKRLEEELRNSHLNLEKKVEEKTKELVMEKERAVAASRAKSEFLANMNHELRTPMNAILGFIYLLSEEETDPRKKRYFTLVQEGSQALLDIINDVLDFSKIESGKFTLNLKATEISQSLKSFIEFLGGAAKKKSINYHVEIDDSIPMIYTDSLRLQQIISNLIGNAVKFTPNNGTISIKLFFERQKNRLCFSVRDNGIGISLTDQEKILQPFSQADMSTTRAYGGTGLGLSISLELIKMLGGKLYINSKEGEGSEFSFSIPCKKAIGTDKGDSPENISKLESIKNRAVLVAEDNTMNLYLYKELFKKLEITDVHFVENGQDALDAYKREQFPLLLLDIDMPIMDGKEVYKQVREYEKEHSLEPSTIIAITASSDYENRENLIRLGFDGFLAKPVNFNTFKEAIEEYL